MKYALGPLLLILVITSLRIAECRLLLSAPAGELIHLTQVKAAGVMLISPFYRWRDSEWLSNGPMGQQVQMAKLRF